MPICALVSNRVFCMHGGLSPSLDNLDQVRKLKLPFECPEVEGLLSDLLWSDPDPSVTGTVISSSFRIKANSTCNFRISAESSWNQLFIRC